MSLVKVTPGGALALAAVAGIGLVLASRKAGQVANAVNPLNHDNIFATSVNTLGGTFFTAPDDPGKNADGSWSFGGWLYDTLNPGVAQQVRDIGKPVATAPAPAPAAPPDPGSTFDSVGSFYSQPGVLF